MSERMSEWPSSYAFLVCSRPQCGGGEGEEEEEEEEEMMGRRKSNFTGGVVGSREPMEEGKLDP